jgi:hypothetical protein
MKPQERECRVHVESIPLTHYQADTVLSPQREIWHRSGEFYTMRLRAITAMCVQTRWLVSMQRMRMTAILSITIPFFNEQLHPHMHWDAAQQIAQAVLDFDKINDQNVRSLQSIDIMSNSLLARDVLSAVFRNMLVASPTPAITDDTTKLTSTPSSNDQWYEIDAVLKRRKRRDGDFYLVKWKGTSETAWVPRRDITDAAVAQYISEHPRRHKRRI